MIKLLCGAVTALFLLSAPPVAAAQEKAFEKTVLPNGVVVLTQEHGDDVAAACVFIKAGMADEPAGKGGVTSLLNRALLTCDPVCHKNPAALVVEQLGGRITVDTRCDFTCFTLTAPLKNMGPALKALADALKNPGFSDAAVQFERDALIADRSMREDRPAERAYRLLLSKTCAASADPDVEKASLGKLTPDDLAAWYGSYYRPENTLVSVCGRLPAASADRMVSEAFEDWPVKDAPPAKTRAASAGAGAGCGQFEEDASAGCAAAVVGFDAPPIGSPDYPAVKFIETALMDGMAASVFRELRDKDGLAYDFGSFMPVSRDWPHMAFYVVTDSDMLGPAVDGIKRSVSRLREGDIGQEELDRARGRAIGEMSIRSETAPERAWSSGVYELLGLGADYGAILAGQIERLQRADIVKAAEKYMNKHTVVMLRPTNGRR